MNIISSFRIMYPWIFKSIIITPVIAFLVLFTVLGEGIVNPFFFKLFYPYTFFIIAGFQIEQNDIWALVVYVGFLLYVFYGIILTISEKKGIIKNVIVILAIAHITAALFCLILLP